jgi:hypothetical protein
VSTTGWRIEPEGRRCKSVAAVRSFPGNEGDKAVAARKTHVRLMEVMGGKKSEDTNKKRPPKAPHALVKPAGATSLSLPFLRAFRGLFDLLINLTT